MCFTTWGPVRHSKNAPWPFRDLAMAVDRFKGFRRLPLRDTSCNSPEATAELLVLWPEARRSVEINPHRSAHHSHPP